MELPLARILVVDDDRHVGATLRDLLLDLGYAVKNAVRGDEALRLIEVFCPDVVLLDLHLPGLPGAEVFELLRREHPGLPVIIVSANTDDGVAGRTLAMGALDYVGKPFTVERLERVVATAVTAAWATRVDPGRS